MKAGEIFYTQYKDDESTREYWFMTSSINADDLVINIESLKGAWFLEEYKGYTIGIVVDLEKIMREKEHED